jgi:hypothetical protein
MDNSQQPITTGKKSVLVLALYDRLLYGEKINKQAYCTSHHVATRTFCRYLVDIRDVLSIYHPDLVLAYDRAGEFHYVVKKENLHH